MLRPITQGCCYQCPSPCGRPLPTHASAGDPHTLRGGLTPSPVGSVLLSPGTWAHIALFLFPPVLWRSCNPVPLAFKVRFPGDSQSLGKIPRLESLMWGLEPSQLCKNFFGIIVLQFVVHPPSKISIWFYGDCALPTISLQLLLCPWMWGIFFWWVLMFSCWWLFNSQLWFCCSGRRWAQSLYSAILNWSQVHDNFKLW